MKYYIIAKEGEFAFIRNTHVPAIFKDKEAAEFHLKESKIKGYEVKEATITVK